MKRIPQRGTFGGVCAGIAYYLKTNAFFIRVPWLIAIILPYTFDYAVIVYILLWLVFPEAEKAPEDYDKICG